MPALRHAHRSARSRRLALGGVAAAAAVAVAACGTGGSIASTTTTTAPATAPPAAAAKGTTISAANVLGVGNVLVNGNGLTLYLLTSERGGKLTCTDDNGCTKVWPDTELPPGVTSATAGSGVDASKLGTIKGSSGNLYVTYAGWPLYTFAHDPGPGRANGEGIQSFGGTWETLTPAGTPVVPPAAAATSPSTAGYHY